MDDQIHSLFDPARFVKAMADIEHDDPEQVPTFRRDQNLKPTFTDAMLFKQKVLALLSHEMRMANVDDEDDTRDTLASIITRIEAIPL